MSKLQTQPNHYSPEREKRVADALRENLAKRKAQQRTKENIAKTDDTLS